MPSVFLSHSSQDKPFVRQLADHLRQHPKSPSGSTNAKSPRCQHRRQNRRRPRLRFRPPHPFAQFHQFKLGQRRVDRRLLRPNQQPPRQTRRRPLSRLPNPPPAPQTKATLTSAATIPQASAKSPPGSSLNTPPRRHASICCPRAHLSSSAVKPMAISCTSASNPASFSAFPACPDAAKPPSLSNSLIALKPSSNPSTGFLAKAAAYPTLPAISPANSVSASPATSIKS